MPERLVEQVAAARPPCGVATDDRSWAPDTQDLDEGDLGSYAWRLIAKGWRHAQRSRRSRALSLAGVALCAVLIALAANALLPALRERISALQQSAQPPTRPCVGCAAPTPTLAPGAKRVSVADDLLACDGCANGDVRARYVSAVETVGQGALPGRLPRRDGGHGGVAVDRRALPVQPEFGLRCGRQNPHHRIKWAAVRAGRRPDLLESSWRDQPGHQVRAHHDRQTHLELRRGVGPLLALLQRDRVSANADRRRQRRWRAVLHHAKRLRQSR